MEQSDSSKSDSEDAEYIPEGDVPSDVSDSDHENSPDVSPKKLQVDKDKGTEAIAGKSAKSEEDQKRLAEIWASFKQDHQQPLKLADEAASKARPDSKKSDTQIVSIKKTYDFAGEEVVVDEKVSVNSKNAKKFLKSEGDGVCVPTASKPPTIPIQQKRGASVILQALQKKPKLSTLEKSRLDWMKYKQQEGLEEQLEQNKKDGYLGKQEFLQRSEMKQYELEREQRMKSTRKLH